MVIFVNSAWNSMAFILKVIFFLIHFSKIEFVATNASLSIKPSSEISTIKENHTYNYINDGATFTTSVVENNRGYKNVLEDQTVLSHKVGGGEGMEGSLNMFSSGSSYFDKLDSLERNVAAVLIKVAYGTTSTTKRSIPDNGNIPSLTTIATPILTTMRYIDKSSHRQQINLHHRNYELDLERDHALPTSAPNADILKSNNNPNYPNPNRYNNHERDRHRHLQNSTPLPSITNVMKKSNGQLPTVPMYAGEIPSYSPPVRSFFTPPLPPEYQNPFADKPTLRGTNNEGVIAVSGSYINRRPIPPPSLMPGHDRIPYRPPDLVISTGYSAVDNNNNSIIFSPDNSGLFENNALLKSNNMSLRDMDGEKKALNTPSRSSNIDKNIHQQHRISQLEFNNSNITSLSTNIILPSIRRILSGSKGKKSEIPEELLKQVTTNPVVNNQHQAPSSPIVLFDSTSSQDSLLDDGNSNSNINHNKIIQHHSFTLSDNKTQHKTSKNEATVEYNNLDISTTPVTGTVHGDIPVSIGMVSSSSTSTLKTNSEIYTNGTAGNTSSSSASSNVTSSSTNWNIAWNIHVYLSAILFTIQAVYIFYKILTYNKLSHLFTQSYFLCIHILLLVICGSRIFYLCYDAYNIHSSFHFFFSEILLNLPATLLTICFAVLILFLFLKSLNHKNNRYSALIRPLTVIVGCGVHVVLCITLHYVESYTLQNQQIYYQQQQQINRRQHHQHLGVSLLTASHGKPLKSYNQQEGNSSSPPRVLSLICQIIYIFICLSLGLLYLYIYRILKRILRSKSQNYIHGYQNLSYAIHITIATALLYVLEASLQIFGAIAISINRPLITQHSFEMDWLQWGYQFSLRVLEIAIIALISWVVGLKSNSGSDTSIDLNTRITESMSNTDRVGTVGGFHAGTVISASKVQKGSAHQITQSNMAGFFLPCTSSSNQDYFETDYPAVCNANTNLHNYTLRTGKLIYDSFALNSLRGDTQSCSQISAPRNSEFHQLAPQQQINCSTPYENRAFTNNQHHRNNFVCQPNQCSTRTTNSSYYQRSAHSKHGLGIKEVTDTDHYENPNFDLHCAGMKQFSKLASNSSSSCAGSGSSASQHQLLLMPSDSCYSEPLPLCANYDFSNFEKPKFELDNIAKEKNVQLDKAVQDEIWSSAELVAMENYDINSKIELSKNHAGGCSFQCLECDNMEICSSNSAHSAISSTAVHYSCYNSIDGELSKSGILNNTKCRKSKTTVNCNSTNTKCINTSECKCKAVHLNHPKINRFGLTNNSNVFKPVDIFQHPSSLKRHIAVDCNELKHQDEQINSISNEIIKLEVNVESTKLISNIEESAGITNDGNILTTLSSNESKLDDINCVELAHSSKLTNSRNIPMFFSNNIVSLDANPTVPTNSSSGTSSINSESCASGTMLVAEQGFVRFRALDDINNAQGVGIHNASVRTQNLREKSISLAVNKSPI